MSFGNVSELSGAVKIRSLLSVGKETSVVLIKWGERGVGIGSVLYQSVKKKVMSGNDRETHGRLKCERIHGYL